MANRKTIQTEESVDDFVRSIDDESKRENCRAIIELMTSATGEVPKMWGTSIVGFGKHHYEYANGKPAEICQVGFAPRARSFAFYFPRFPEHDALVQELGKHKYSGGCLHIIRLTDVNIDVLTLMVECAYRAGAKGDV